jgi:hypothetical protein
MQKQAGARCKKRLEAAMGVVGTLASFAVIVVTKEN